MQEALQRKEAMITTQLRRMRLLEGRRVCVALRDGSRVDDADLVSAPSTVTGTVWLFINGDDRFVPAADLVEVWEAPAVRRAA